MVVASDLKLLEFYSTSPGKSKFHNILFRFTPSKSVFKEKTAGFQPPETDASSEDDSEEICKSLSSKTSMTDKKSPLSSPVESDLFNCFLRSSKLEVAKKVLAEEINLGKTLLVKHNQKEEFQFQENIYSNNTEEENSFNILLNKFEENSFESNLVELLRSLQEKKIEMFRSIKSLDENFTAINSKRTFIINRMMKSFQNYNEFINESQGNALNSIYVERLASNIETLNIQLEEKLNLFSDFERTEKLPLVNAIVKLSSLKKLENFESLFQSIKNEKSQLLAASEMLLNKLLNELKNFENLLLQTKENQRQQEISVPNIIESSENSFNEFTTFEVIGFYNKLKEVLKESEEQIYLLETQENELKTLNTLKKSLRKVLNKQNENNIQQTLQELAELYTFYNAKDARLHAASLQWTARFLVERTANDAVKEKAANTAHFVALLFQNFPGVILFFLKEVYRFAPQLIPFRLTEDSIPVFEKISFQGININEKVPPKEKDEFRIFINKISAVTSLFCALLAYDCYEPLDTSLCWFWLSAVCNKKLDKTFAYLLQVFLEFAGKKLCEKYKKQFQKILYYIKVNLINEEECRKIQLEDGVVRILHKLINDLNVSAKPVGYY